MCYLFIYYFYSNQKEEKKKKTLYPVVFFFLFFPIFCLQQQLLTPTWLNLVFFVFSYLFVSNNNSNPNVILFGIFVFFLIFYFKKYIFCFYNYLNLVWLNFYIFSLFNPKKKKTNLQKKNRPNFWEFRWLFIFQ